MRENIEIKGIRDSDIDAFLEKFGELENFIQGKIKCNCCAEPISMANLGGFIIKNNRLVIFCNHTDCLEYGDNSNEC